jgi:mRNA interferase MazF
VSVLRGQVYRCDLGHGLKPWLIISNNRRNELLETVIAIRITTTAKDLPTRVPLAPGDPLGGYAIADDIEQLYKDELRTELGSLTQATMREVDKALKLALGIRDEG